MVVNLDLGATDHSSSQFVEPEQSSVKDLERTGCSCNLRSRDARANYLTSSRDGRPPKLSL